MLPVLENMRQRVDESQIEDGTCIALGCGHDHVNDFCALLPSQTKQDGHKEHGAVDPRPD